jgi:hypothetical protein
LREDIARAECLRNELLRGIDEPEQRTKHQRRAENVTDHRRQAERAAHIGGNCRNLDLLAVFRREAFRKAEIDPRADHHALHRHRGKDRAPISNHQDQLADRRRNRGHHQEDHEDQAHHAGHLVAAHPVADDRRGKRNDRRPEEALSGANGNQAAESCRQRARQ